MSASGGRLNQGKNRYEAYCCVLQFQIDVGGPKTVGYCLIPGLQFLGNILNLMAYLQ